MRIINIVSGLFLIGIGILFLTNTFQRDQFLSEYAHQSVTQLTQRA